MFLGELLAYMEQINIKQPMPTKKFLSIFTFNVKDDVVLVKEAINSRKYLIKKYRN